MMKTNDVLLRNVTKVVAFIIFLFSLHLFFAGHYNP
ncbi:Na(+)/H(+) antiporter subunit B, partial [Escherichia coli]|nr:Na(+)/H(+) antiporter subunit B [Escherichia coli]